MIRHRYHLGAKFTHMAADPGVTDDTTRRYIANVSEWRNTDTGAVFVCTDHTEGAAVWGPRTQADADLIAIAALPSAADKAPYSTGAGAWALAALTAFGRSLWAAANAAAGRTILELGTLATQSGTFSGTSSGTNTGDQTSVSGNAGTATALQTARTIGGVSFNGTANISTPGTQLDYAEKTSDTSLTATTEDTANTIVTGAAVAYDGTTAIVLEFCAVSLKTANSVGEITVSLWLYQDGTSIGRIATLIKPDESGTLSTANTGATPVHACVRFTPAVGTHTYSVRGTTSAGTSTVTAGAGGNGVAYPATLKITKA